LVLVVYAVTQVVEDQAANTAQFEIIALQTLNKKS
jgi:hypothetical protein